MKVTVGVAVSAEVSVADGVALGAWLAVTDGVELGTLLAGIGDGESPAGRHALSITTKSKQGSAFFRINL